MVGDEEAHAGGWKTEGLVLAAIAVLALVLRLWRLDFRPLSTDETLTVIISIGRSYRDVPIGEVWPLTELSRLFTPVYGLSWGDITRTLNDPLSHHEHAPLFYWVLYGWINWARPLATDLVSSVRFLPAVFGTMTVALTYGLARTSVSRQAGVVAALLMAVSPIGVSMAQDARNYTLPLIFIISALWALAAIVIRSANGRSVSWALWAGWATASALSCYAHYFSILSVVAQAAALVVLVGKRRILVRAGLGLVATATACVPLAQTLWQNYTRVSSPGTGSEWMHTRGFVDPLGELLDGWAWMIGPMSNEFMPPWMALATIPIVAAMALAVALSASGLIGRLRWPGSPAVVMLALFSAVVFVEMLVIVYGLGKDLFRYPRYHFVYFPAALVLIAAGFTSTAGTLKSLGRWRGLSLAALVFAGLAGTTMRSYGYGNDDAFNSRRIAREILQSGGPALTVMGGDTFLTTAMGLSIAREIAAQASATRAGELSFGYVPWPSTRETPWPGALTTSASLPAHVWLIHRPNDTSFPPPIEVKSALSGDSRTCAAGSEGVRRFGLEFQRYECPTAR